ncbi:uncharacterized protein LOC101765057 [Setaria italica]|uniref:uncharacterized protein LOC101765057 n=1 Tax=Setaria italica TaxID=4555 RepID=UPI0003510986|nr:uncharacterized protein LOC101765057 [Setaria italica]
MPPMVINGVTVEDKDVLVVVHQEGGGERKPRSSRCSGVAQRKIETSFKYYNNVIFEAKDMHNLLDYFGGLWTEGAQYKISRVKKRYAYALAYRGELMDALKHVNRYLGGNISFISDDFESFEGLHAGAALTDEKRLTGHSGRCFVVKLTRFST